MTKSTSTIAATAIIILGLAVTVVVLPTNSAVDIFAVGAVCVGIALTIATLIEGMSGPRELIRVDILMLWVLYGLTFLEFLFPQPDVEELLTPHAASLGAYATLLGFAGLSLGRHLVPLARQGRQQIVFNSSHLFSFFMVASAIGYLHILIAVSFDPFEMLRQMSLPRFSQSWGRGKFGDAYSLLYELGMLIYLLPAMGGLIYARSNEFSAGKKALVAAILAVTVYYAFASGTRNVIGTYVIAFAGTYFLTKPRINFRQILMIGIPTLATLLVATTFMLEFRQIGLTNYSSADRHYNTLFIDHNLVNLAQLTQVFPESISYLGLEIPYQALIKPIPRFIWSGKPEGLSTSIEDALGAAPTTTLACTFVGEAYMAGGLLGVILAGLFFGAAAELWNRVGRDAGSSFSQIMYASGFLCAAMGMRSMLTMVPFVLPTVALWVYGRFFLSKAMSKQSRAVP